MKRGKLKFIDLFAGLGGFHLAMNNLGHECVFASELHQDLRGYYENNFHDINPEFIIGNIHDYSVTKIPPHDILCAGFPCQPFSKAGNRKGLEDPVNGNHFNKIMEILNLHKPKYVFLENVPNLDSHDNGKTWEKINLELTGEYDVQKKILSPHEFGVPQHRKRVYIVGVRKDEGGLKDFDFEFNGKLKGKTNINTILEKGPDNFLPLRKISKEHLNVWQEFLDNLSIEEAPSFPIWTAEFKATYPFEDKSTTSYSANQLKEFNGKFGCEINGKNKKEVVDCLPSYARTNQKVFPPWKQNYIRKNREFYQIHKKWIDKWLPKIKNWEHSHQKFEWNCGKTELRIKGNIIQFRPSGIRVKKPETSPALVLSSTQIPIVYDEVLEEYRYMTITEAARLQSMDSLKTKPAPIGRAFRAFGNAVNVTVVEEIGKKLISYEKTIR
jgi:DNA (cytosine-5)-methyltransferase 1